MRSDSAHKWADRRLAAMEKRIEKIYAQAQEEVDKKLSDFTAQFRAKAKQKLADMKAGKIDAEEYKRWLRTQLFIKDEWKQTRGMLADEYIHANQTALAYINGNMPEVWAVGYNAIGDAAESAMAGYSFHMVDAETVRLLTTDNSLLLPPPTKKLNLTKDERWNLKKINNQIRQGILQGESIGEIASRLQKVTDMNRKGALRNARTMVTAAENRGRMSSYERLERDGATVEREWIAAIDRRTRHAHQVLDGQKKKMGEAFVYDGDEIEYPGDPSAKPYLVYNCRCTVSAEVVAYKGRDVRTSYYEKGKDGEGTEAFEKKRSEAEKRKEAEALTAKEKRDIIKSGARITNVYGKAAEKHAERYYEFVRNSESQASHIAKNTGYDEQAIRDIEDYLFRNLSLYNEDTKQWELFAPDFAIAQSWQRLADGKNIQPHDLTLLKHEMYEMEIKRKKPDIAHLKAHEMAQDKYNYQKESDEYYDNLKKHKKRRKND